MRQAVIWGAGILVSAGLLYYEPLSFATNQGASRAVIDTADGYGVSECLAGGEACGAQLAQAWCRSNGYRRVVAYRKANAEDITSASGMLIVGEKGGSVVINCGS
jgi:hypothetical protein